MCSVDQMVGTAQREVSGKNSEYEALGNSRATITVNNLF